jgi:hypothetical protein
MLMLLVHYPVCSHPLQPFSPLFLRRCFAECSLESRLVVAVLEDDRVFHPSHHDRLKGAGSRICLGTECKNILVISDRPIKTDDVSKTKPKRAKRSGKKGQAEGEVEVSGGGNPLQVARTPL